MKAAVWKGPYDLVVEDVPRPTPSKSEVLIKTRAVGICGSDLEIYDGRFKFSKPPLIIGHEGGGVVEAVGDEVTGFQPGERVVAECLLYCGRCEYCRQGKFGLCDNTAVLGMIDAQGEYAEYYVAPEKNCYPLPDGISWPEVGLIDTLAGPTHGFKQINVKPDDTVAVLGPGPAGLFFCRLAKIRGASRVFLVGTKDNRLQFGPAYGADVMIHTGRDNVAERILEETGGRGADIVIEASGTARAMMDSTKILKKAGTLLIYGVFGGGPVQVDVQAVQQFELTVLGSCGSDYHMAIKLIESGKIPVKELVSHTFNLEELVEAFSNGFIQERRDNYVKGVVLFP